jgi:ribose 5-phosphate isomerase A
MLRAKEMNDKEDQKKRAAKEASLLVKDNEVIGLGTGSTVNYLIEYIAERIQKENLHIRAVPTSIATAECARRNKIELTTLAKNPKLDIDIDGADQVDPKINLIKGLGGALTREKIVASASHQFVIVVDKSKMTDTLGKDQVLPVEVIPFAVPLVTQELQGLGGKPTMRIAKGSSEFYVTDNGNNVLDVDFGPIEKPDVLGPLIKMIPGVVEHGLFVEMANAVYVGQSDKVQQIWK